MKILFNYAENPLYIEGEKRDYSGVGYYRIVKMAQQVKGHQVDVMGHDIKQFGKTLEEKWDNIFKEYDVFWTFYHCSDKEASAMYYFRDKYNKKVVIDIDDNYLDVLPTNPLYDNLKAGKKDKAMITAMLSFADVITCSTEPLSQRIGDHMKEVYGLDKKVVVLPNFNDLNDWNFPIPERNKDKIVIGYAGSNSHYDDLVMIMPHVSKLMNKYKNLYFHTVGLLSADKLHLFKDFSKESLNRCEILSGVRTRDYPKMLIEANWDIAIAPLVDSAFTRSKSHIKWMENASCKVPVVASRVYPYFVDLYGRNIIKHEDTGLLVKPSEWYDALESLILSKEKRNRIGENGYNAVKNNWQYKDSNLGHIINEMLSVI